MNDDGSDGAYGAGEEESVHWPTPLRGVTECVVATEGPDGRYNLAALGVHAPDNPATDGETVDDRATDGEPVDDPSTADVPPDEPVDRDPPPSTAPATARTWGSTRTARNFRERGRGRVIFTGDPLAFVRAALQVWERDDRPESDAWVAAWADVRVEPVREGEEGATTWVDWELHPVDAGVERQSVATLHRGAGAVLEASVDASRLDVPGYDAEALRARIDHAADVVERCGGPRERAAMALVEATVADADGTTDR